MSFNGTDAWGETVNAIGGPNTFSLTAWFKTPPTSDPKSGGSIIGFSDAQGLRGQSNYDRMLWIERNGSIHFGAYPNSGGQLLVSPGSYADGSWHFVVVTVSTVDGGALYIDGALVTSNANMLGGQNYNGWWHLAYSNAANTWTSGLNNGGLFDGSLAEVAVFPTELTASAITSLYGARSSSSNYIAAQNVYAPTDVWAMSDLGSATYSADVPGMATVPDLSGNASPNTGLPQGGVTIDAAGPFGSSDSKSVDLNGVGGSYIAVTNAMSPTIPLTEVAWFKTSASGTIMSFTGLQGDNNNQNPSHYDRQLFVDNGGHVVFGVYDNGTQDLSSTGTYADNKWHLVVASVGSAGQQLYVDGQYAATTNTAITSAEGTTEYVHIGYGYYVYWPIQPTDPYFQGSLAQVALLNHQVTFSEDQLLFAQTSSSGFANDIQALSEIGYWPLNGTIRFNLCDQIGLTVQETIGSVTTCVYPAGPSNCPTLAANSVNTLTGFANAASTGISLGPVTATAPVILAFSTAVVGKIPAAYVGLHAVNFLTIAASNNQSLAQISYPLAGAQF